MPELPEVEVICRQLNTKICGKKIAAVDVLLARMLRNNDAMVLNKLIGDCFEKVERHGKYIFIETMKKQVLLVHLRMTGRLIYHDVNKDNEERYERLRFTFVDNSYLTYGDTRTLGAVYYFENKEAIDIPGYLALGIEPLSDEFTAKACYDLTKNSKMNIKAFLLNQKYITGLGNIYVDESLFASHINPKRRANSLSAKEAERLQQEIRRLLSASIEHGGTTFRDYKNSDGEVGNNQKYLKVYGRGGENCLVCNNELSVATIGGRTTVFCSKCQPYKED